MTFSHKCYLPVTKKIKELLNSSLCSPKTTDFDILANFGQLCMVSTYIAIVKNFEIVQDAYRCNLKSQEF